MAKTVEQILSNARYILQDEVIPYRNSVDDLLVALNSGLYELKRLRPDAWLSYLGVGEELPQYADVPLDLAMVIPINPMFYQSLIYFISGYAELKDDEYTVDSRAALLLRAFGNNNTQPGSVG
jgi:hypothetical protein